MFSKCESDVLDGVSLQLSTPVVPVVHITPCTVALYRPQRDRRVSHLSLCLSPAKHSLSFFFSFSAASLFPPHFTLSSFSQIVNASHLEKVTLKLDTVFCWISKWFPLLFKQRQESCPYRKGETIHCACFFFHFVLHEFASFSVLPTSRNLKNE